MAPAERHRPTDAPRVPLTVVVREWGRLGCIGFGGPPTHIRLLRELCVERRGWIGPDEFEDAIAACNLLPGPASTQLAIYCASRVAGRRGALVGGVAFILPGLCLILALAAVFLGDPPTWVLAAGAGAGSAVPAVALHAGWSLVPSSWERAASRLRWICYAVLAAAATVLVGAWVVLVLLACGSAELAIRRPRPPRSGVVDLNVEDDPGGARLGAAVPLLTLTSGAFSTATLGALAWVALKVGALSYGGGFVIIPLMQADAVEKHHWMSSSEFLNAVALGQITPGPVVQTVGVVGYAAAGLLGGVLAAVIAFSPSFLFVVLGAGHFDRLRADPRARAFLDGSGPAAIGAILGTAWLLATALDQPWQYAVLAASTVAVLALRRSVVLVLLGAAALGVVLVLLGAPLS